ncbi:hypothetical protein ACQKIC_01525 [Peribacillus sp. NPDC046944]|uniref:hypothetical protein n=1 Tax=unclassified Peribacillus TaxID=2675266 RepID=UPI003D094C04
MIDWQWVEVDTLERQEKWNEAKSLLIKSWRQNPQDLKVAIRLGFFCWYVLVQEGPLGIKDVDFNELEAVLKEVTHCGMANFITNEDFLWCFGYMISLFPYYFGDYEYWEEKGISMNKSAYERCPDDPIYTYSYLASFPNTDQKLKGKFHQVKDQVKAVLEDRFQGEGVLSEYFRDVWRS